MTELVYVTTDDCHFCAQGRGVLDELGVERREIADSSDEAAALGGGMHADTASHTFILVDKSGKVRFDQDYPNMWVEPSTLLKLLPKLS